ncbi:MAG: type II secretion system F family protein [Butyrivibrio sp.]|nr:type II secretion system F family protein [Butyrivibrio sp.]
MSKLFILYLIFPAAMGVLFILSRDYELPPGIEETGISRAFLKISLFIYEKFFTRVRPHSSEKVRSYLETLEHRKDLRAAETEYFIRKISIVLLMATAGSFLSLMMSISSLRSGHIEDGGILRREPFGERGYEAELVASDDEGNELGEYEFKVNTRAFSEDEADELYERASDELESAILLDNPSLNEVTTDLDLVEKLPGYPFDIRWRVDNYEVMHLDGKLITEAVPSDGAVVMLTADFSYREKRWQSVLYANVMPRQLSAAEKFFNGIKEKLQRADEESLESDVIELPREYGGVAISWSERARDNSILLLIITLIGGAASYVLKDKELKDAMEKRSASMLSDYPQLVSKLVLYMGAGMSMRNIFLRLAGSYAGSLKSGREKNYLYEEILRTGRELGAGASEAAAYEQLGARCQVSQYTRLTTLLSQNLRKGNSELLSLLREESAKAFEERMDRVRKKGEEAGTKLLLPMIIMLVIVMVIIMIPAYMAF